jgi:predicted nucleic acid-binding protein
MQTALETVDVWLKSSSLVVLSETEGYWEEIRSLILEGHIVGPRVHDARIAALCLLHGVSELWTADRDFGRFPGLTVRNPLVG